MHRSLRIVPLVAFAALLAACSGNPGASSLPAGPATSTGASAAAPTALVPLNVRTVPLGPLDIRIAGGVAHMMPKLGSPLSASGSAPHNTLGGTNMKYQNAGAPVQCDPHIYIVYWGWTSDPQGEKTVLEGFLNGVLGSSWLSSQTIYYHQHVCFVGNTARAVSGIWADNTNPIPNLNTMSDSAGGAALQGEATAAATHFGIASNDPNANIFIATPHGNSTAGFAANGGPYCAYHHFAAPAWTNMPYMSDAGVSCGSNNVNLGNVNDGVSIVGGHEQAETETDPLGTAWFDNSGWETGDKCAWGSSIPSGRGVPDANQTFSTGTYATQALWSNSTQGPPPNNYKGFCKQ